MKIEIENQKLQKILKMLYLDNLFPFSIVTVKDSKLFAAQNDKEGFAMRYAVFTGDWFKSITTKEESVQLDVVKIMKYIKLNKKDEILTLEYPVEKKLKISDENGVATSINCSIPNPDDVKKKLPFVMKGKNKDIPHINKGKIAIDTIFTIDLKSLKNVYKVGNNHGTEFYKFRIGKDKKLQIIVGDINEVEDFSKIDIDAQIDNCPETLNVTFTKGIAEMAKTFSGDVKINMRSHMPAWFSEVTHNHKFGVLLSPIRGDDDYDENKPIKTDTKQKSTKEIDWRLESSKEDMLDEVNDKLKEEEEKQIELPIEEKVKEIKIDDAFSRDNFESGRDFVEVLEAIEDYEVILKQANVKGLKDYYDIKFKGKNIGQILPRAKCLYGVKFNGKMWKIENKEAR